MKSIPKRTYRVALISIMAILNTLIGGPVAANADTPALCTDVTILGARGTGEGPTSGPVLSYINASGFGDSAGNAAVKLNDELKVIAPDITINLQGLEYPAQSADFGAVSTTFISSGSFNESVKAGVYRAVQNIDDIIQSCPKTQIVMMGYSQGAEVMHEAAIMYFDTLHPERSGNLSKVWLISDPTTWHVSVQDAPGGASYFNELGEGVIPNGKGLISLMATNGWSPTNVGGEFGIYTKDKTVEVCHTADLVCNTGDSGALSLAEAQEVAAQTSLLFPDNTHGNVYKSPLSDIHAAPTTKNAPDIARTVALMHIPDSAPKMVSTWDTNQPGCQEITLPVTGAINARVEWGDGSESPIVGANPSHKYAISQYYSPDPTLVTATITGTFTGWNASPSAKCLIEVSRWDETGTTNLSSAFRGAVNLTKVAKIPTGVTIMGGIFDGATSFNYPIVDWDVSKVTVFTYAFRNASTFNQPIGDWDVSKVASMSSMFAGATSFNQPIGSWSLLKLKAYSGMFVNASSFNQDLHMWKLDYTNGMFQGCPIFAEYKPSPVR